ncbi:MAG: MFS transporter [Oscillospiraceae bacterium]|jgi:MFS family permease|nr:MFS transporter [Oscillospiraceae bacterium]
MNRTLNASCFGYVTQAIVNNFAPLLFLTFRSEFGIPLSRITLLISVNFAVQLLVDFFLAGAASKIGYRKLAVFGHVCAALGLAGLAAFPAALHDPTFGLLLAVIVYAVGGGVIEVIVSPIVEAIPADEGRKKSAAMSLLHSFYCWGHLFVVLCTTLFFTLFGIANWRILAVIWALLPLANSVYFSRVPITTLEEAQPSLPIRKLLSAKTFWLFVVLMVCAGASEQAMSQWASVFAEAGLKVSKTVGDLAGPCVFAALMGLARLSYSLYSEKIKLRVFMVLSAALSVCGYLLASLAPDPALSLAGTALCGLAAGILWPGTYSLSTAAIPGGGTAMFALLALAGDLGCSLGPGTVGAVSEAGGLKAGLAAAVIFPAVLLVCLFSLRRKRG